VVIINLTNINKTNNHPSSLLNSEHKKDHDIWGWKCKSWFWTRTTIWRGKPANWITTLPVYKTFWELFVNVMNYFQKEYIKYCKNTGSFNSNFHMITTTMSPYMAWWYITYRLIMYRWMIKKVLHITFK